MATKAPSPINGHNKKKAKGEDEEGRERMMNSRTGFFPVTRVYGFALRWPSIQPLRFGLKPDWVIGWVDNPAFQDSIFFFFLIFWIRVRM